MPTSLPITYNTSSCQSLYNMATWCDYSPSDQVEIINQVYKVQVAIFQKSSGEGERGQKCARFIAIDSLLAISWKEIHCSYIKSIWLISKSFVFVLWKKSPKKDEKLEIGGWGPKVFSRIRSLHHYTLIMQMYSHRVQYIYLLNLTTAILGGNPEKKPICNDSSHISQ